MSPFETDEEACSIELDGAQVVERGLGVRLRPQSDRAALVNGVVLRLQLQLSVVEALDPVADMTYLQGMPFAGLAFQVLLRLQLNTLSLDDFVNSKVPFEGVETGRVIVVRVLITPEYTA